MPFVNTQTCSSHNTRCSIVTVILIVTSNSNGLIIVIVILLVLIIVVIEVVEIIGINGDDSRIACIKDRNISFKGISWAKAPLNFL